MGNNKVLKFLIYYSVIFINLVSRTNSDIDLKILIKKNHYKSLNN